MLYGRGKFGIVRPFSAKALKAVLERGRPALFLPAFVLAACAGGGSGAAPSGGQPQQVSGTLSIATAPTTPSSKSRRPAFVGQGTTHAWVFINGALTPSNTSGTCTGTQTTGSGTFCTISWGTSLAVPASYTFKVTTDDGSKVLAEGSATFAITSGANSVGPLTLNGVAAKATYATTSCTSGTAGTTAGTCAGTITVQDNASDAIAYTGATTVPTAGLSPTNGTIFDNGSATLTSSSASGLVTGTAQTASSNVFSTFASNTLTLSGVNTTGVYTYAVACATATTTGSFGITLGGSSGRTSGVNVLDTQLANESPVPTYPTSISATSPTYVCTNGVISSATGTLPIN
jgi:hypothetical protein